MIAGLPGTGIGGLFYVLLAISMPIVEFYRRCLGRGPRTKIFFIGFHLSMVVGIVGALWGGGMLLLQIFERVETVAPHLTERLLPSEITAMSVLVPTVAFFQIAVLGCLVLFLNIASWILRQAPDPHPDVRVWER